MMRILIFLNLFLWASVSFSSWELGLSKGSGNVDFRAKGKGGVLIHGKGTNPTGSAIVDKGQATGTFSFKLDTFDSGVPMRNEHMKKKYLETDKFPDAKFELSSIKFPENFSPKDYSKKEIPFEGKLTLHGVTTPLKAKADVVAKDQTVTIDTQFPVKLSDYKIATPSFMGITVAEEVQVEIHFTGPLVEKK